MGAEGAEGRGETTPGTDRGSFGRVISLGGEGVAVGGGGGGG